MTAHLRVVRQPALITVPAAAHEQLHLELVVARGERLRHATETRTRLRSAMRLLVTGSLAAAATLLLEAERLLEAEALRAMSMESPACPCGGVGSGHGDGDDQAVAA